MKARSDKAGITHCPPRLFRASPGERRNGRDDAAGERYYREAYAEVEVYQEALRRAQQREHECREALAKFRKFNDETVLSTKQLLALEIDLAAATADVELAASELARISK